MEPSEGSKTPGVIERAATGRAKCRACENPIASGEWRFGERLPNPFAEDGGQMTHWFHLACAALTRPEPFLEALAITSEVIQDRERLEREARLGAGHRRLPRVRKAERAPSGRAACRSCREPIDKGAWRITLVYHEDGRFVPSGFIHPRCAGAYLETTEVLDRLKHFSPTLTEMELTEIGTELDVSGRS